ARGTDVGLRRGDAAWCLDLAPPGPTTSRQIGVLEGAVIVNFTYHRHACREQPERDDRMVAPAGGCGAPTSTMRPAVKPRAVDAAPTYCHVTPVASAGPASRSPKAAMLS